MNRRVKKGLGIGCGGLVFVLLFGIGWVNVDIRRSASRLRTEQTEAQRVGLPLTPAEVRLPVLPAAENAATIYARAFEMDTPGSSADDDLSVVEPAMVAGATPQDLASAKAAIGRLGPLFEVLRGASRLSKCQFPADWTHVTHPDLSYLAHLRRFARALGFAAQMRGDGKEALADLKVVHRMAQHLQQQPFSENLTAAGSIEGTAEGILDKLLRSRGHDPAFLAAARSFHASFGSLPDFRAAFRTDLVRALATIDQAKTLGDIDENFRFFSRDLLSLFWTPEFKRASEEKLIAAYVALFSAWGAPTGEPDAAAWNRLAEAGRTIRHQVGSDHSLSNLLANALFPHPRFFTDRVASQQMRFRLTETALSLLEARAKAAKFPARLPSLGVLSTDPFSGNPFGYLTKPPGIILYSVGPDRVDDGGQSHPKGRKTYDVAVNFE